MRRLARLLCCLPSSKTLDSWLVLVVVHVQSALRRLRDMVIATITPEAEPEQTDPRPSPANAECAFCVGELQGVVTQIEDLFETLDTLNRFRPALIGAAMDSDSSTYASFSSMLQVPIPLNLLGPVASSLYVMLAQPPAHANLTP